MNKKLIGQYKLIKKIATGGMGEVYLVYDPQCKRNIVIKKIKEDIQEKPSIQKRFLQEATITNKLAHPYIIPIYSVNMEKELYYTMPYIEDAQTLHQLIHKIKNNEKEYDLQSMLRFFLNICEVTSYAHSKKIIHQDIKPDNILIGKYGQLFLLDWGIAIFNNNDIEYQKTQRRISGTLNFLAPERINGGFPSIRTEIYSLGVLLYQMLTLETPFKQRTSLLSFKKNVKKEILKDPIEVAPDRDIPYMLNEITKKCLKFNPIERYEDVDALIKDIKDFINGNPKWVLIHEMNIKNEKNWQINDPILLSKHTAISANINLSEWVIAKIAKLHLYENLRIDLKVKFTNDTNGLGIIFSIPDIRHSTSIKNSYCLWLSNFNSTFLRSFVLIKQLPVQLEKNIFYDINIEKIDNKIIIKINNNVYFTFIDYFAIRGDHIGILFKDENFIIEKFSIFSATNKVLINCLSIPDSFLAKKDYKNAILEYRKIIKAFPGRKEEREAIFKTGLSLIEEAKRVKNKTFAKKIINDSLNEFDKLESTHSAPLEYLGKAMAYSTLNDYKEEAKCLELAIRRYKKHSLSIIIEEHIIARVHQASLEDRDNTYRILLIALRFLNDFSINNDNKKLIKSITSTWHNDLFLKKDTKDEIALQLAYRLGNKVAILELCNKFIKENEIDLLKQSIFCLLKIRQDIYVKKLLKKITHLLSKHEIDLLKIALLSKKNLNKALQLFEKTNIQNKNEIQIFAYLLQLAIDKRSLEIITLKDTSNFDFLTSTEKMYIDSLYLQIFLLRKDLPKATQLIEKYPLSILSDEKLYFHYLYGCWLFLTKSKNQATAYFQSVYQELYPSIYTLLSHYLIKNISLKKTNMWHKTSFHIEKQHLFRQLALFYNCTSEKSKEALFLKKLEQNI